MAIVGGVPNFRIFMVLPGVFSKRSKFLHFQGKQLCVFIFVSVLNESQLEMERFANSFLEEHAPFHKGYFVNRINFFLLRIQI